MKDLLNFADFGNLNYGSVRNEKNDTEKNNLIKEEIRNISNKIKYFSNAEIKKDEGYFNFLIKIADYLRNC